MKNILIAVDFHERTQLFIEKVQELAKSFDSKVWLLHVAPADDAGSKRDSHSETPELSEEHVELQLIKRHLIDQGIETEAFLVQGPTIESIFEKVAEYNIDLIISGQYKHGFLYRALYGNTTQKLIEKSKVPVLVVPLDD